MKINFKFVKFVIQTLRNKPVLKIFMMETSIFPTPSLPPCNTAPSAANCRYFPPDPTRSHNKPSNTFHKKVLETKFIRKVFEGHILCVFLFFLGGGFIPGSYTPLHTLLILVTKPPKTSKMTKCSFS